ncbi:MULTISPECIES: mitomycin antibiotics/polyketide fumonisin biosynthesis protein [Mycobacterium]|uniref:Mitomycin antibiotics/polyketide fumonisin biosynthesis protein n=1 Tax=Mycobacterium syngnathidarum TaxID=1908205 RepID=A0A1S1KN97_9MYCO|nr:mitomycin antibiotics/polyketide fumonisin biosynthesis protein [Mycobacterium syngnathidarum]OLT87981.1 mitomycin antibiotics/polyketide fumonisin biosynthesis protein [Mycobacterium syngnathidarum]
MIGTPRADCVKVVGVVDVDAFKRDGFVKIEQAVPPEIADAARDLLWRQIGLSPQDPASWTKPVMWAADLTGAGPFGQLARSVRLGEALDQLCGTGAWQPRGSLGNIPVRFPVDPPADDRGWHIDANTPLPGGQWAVSGRPHTVLVLTLLSAVGPDDAPTRLRVGSHRDVAGVLGPEPLDFIEAGALVDEASRDRPVAHATGRPGDMYVVHPFTAHAADVHRGSTPRFMAQGPVVLAENLGPAGPSALASVWDGLPRG